MSVRIKHFGFIAIALATSGCNIMGGPSGDNIKQAIINRTPEVALNEIKLDDYGEGDSVLFYLEKGALHKMARQFDQSNQAFDAAKQKMEELYTSSVTQGIGSVLLNDNAVDYEGEFFENLMAHSDQVLNYLEMGSPENAAVIARQIDTKLNLLNDKKGDKTGNVYKCDPYASYISGVAYEAINDWNSARVTYENALKCYSNSIFKIGTPTQLKEALINAAYQSGASSLYRRYKQEFGIDSKPVSAKANGELVFVLDEGFIVAKRETSIQATATTPQGIRQVKIAMPELPKDNPHLVTQVRVKINGNVFEAERVHDLDSAARAALDEHLPAIHARAIARAVKNQQIQKEAGDRGGLFGQLFAVVATNAIENADVRGWRSLPHTVWMSRKILPPGTYNIEVELLGATGVMNIKKYDNVVIDKGSKKTLYLRWGATPPQNQSKQVGVNVLIL